MYKFFGDPLQEVKGAQSGKVVFRFDSNGEYCTEDPMIISRTIGHFDHVVMEAKVTGERVKRTIITPPIAITTTTEPVAKKFKCKQCSFSTDEALDYARHSKQHKG